MLPHIVQRDAFAVMGIQARFHHEDKTFFDTMWMQRFMPLEPQVAPLSTDKAYYGVFFPLAGEEGTDYVAGMAVDAAQVADVPEGLVVRQVPAAQYAVHQCTVRTIGEAFDYLEKEWLPSMPYQRIPAHPDFEQYPPDTTTADSPVLLHIPVQDGALIVEKGSLLLAGTRYQGRNEQGEVPAMWDTAFLPRMGELAALRVGSELYGVGRAVPGLPVEQGFEYLAGARVSSLEGLPSGMVGWEIPAQSYVVLPAHNVPDIGRVDQYFYRQWLPEHPEYEGGEVMMEVYPDESYSQDGMIYLHLPIRRKA